MSENFSDPPRTQEESKVFVIEGMERRKAIKELMEYSELSGNVAIKPNYNSADPFPASTHEQTLSTIVDCIKENSSDIVLAERSGMGETAEVLRKRGVTKLASEKGFEIVVLDDLSSEDWIEKDVQGSHWENGFLFPKHFQEADSILQTCCLKTHRYGGHFTMSLKNSVGMVAQFGKGHDYMDELHKSPHQRKMIAEINTAYEPNFIIMDGIKGFSEGGPARGKLIEPGMVLASMDRVALDAVGVAILRMYGSTPEVEEGTVFQQDQIARAVELDLGVISPDEIELVPLNEKAETFCDEIGEQLF